MANMADEHLKALAGQASTPINSPWGAGTQTQRASEFDRSLAWDKQKHASQLAAATRGSSPYGAGAEGFAAMRQGAGVDPEIADLDPARQEVYALVKDAIASGDNFDVIYNTLDVARKRGKLTDKEMKELAEFAEMIFEEEISKATSRNVVQTPHENVGQYMNRLAQVGQQVAPAARQGSSLDAFRQQQQQGVHGDGFLGETAPLTATGTGTSALTSPAGIQALVKKIMGR